MVLNEQPRLPAEWDPAEVRLEMITELFSTAEPKVRRQVWHGVETEEARDDLVIDFGAWAIVTGKSLR